ncbi:dentin sialophosphoprotein-like isoform X2 [Trichogramma pretiosum]|uniref:dentin sialophosphoprotein-like isoform X2 n=1 Tax=Trichogramma pretiosum TaxID=7493 RepID=UPI0006C953F3|nr:dentin sialophosphoprotein-like isoform X2 [Trichogramma pretiosum]
MSFEVQDDAVATGPLKASHSGHRAGPLILQFQGGTAINKGAASQQRSNKISFSQDSQSQQNEAPETVKTEQTVEPKKTAKSQKMDSKNVSSSETLNKKNKTLPVESAKVKRSKYNNATTSRSLTSVFSNENQEITDPKITRRKSTQSHSVTENQSTDINNNEENVNLHEILDSTSNDDKNASQVENTPPVTNSQASNECSTDADTRIRETCRTILNFGSTQLSGTISAKGQSDPTESEENKKNDSQIILSDETLNKKNIPQSAKTTKARKSKSETVTTTENIDHFQTSVSSDEHRDRVITKNTRRKSTQINRKPEHRPSEICNNHENSNVAGVLNATFRNDIIASSVDNVPLPSTSLDDNVKPKETEKNKKIDSGMISSAETLNKKNKTLPAKITKSKSPKSENETTPKKINQAQTSVSSDENYDISSSNLLWSKSKSSDSLPEQQSSDVSNNDENPGKILHSTLKEDKCESVVSLLNTSPIPSHIAVNLSSLCGEKISSDSSDKSLSVGSEKTSSDSSDKSLSVGSEKSSSDGIDKNLSVGSKKSSSDGSEKSSSDGSDKSLSVGSDSSSNSLASTGAIKKVTEPRRKKNAYNSQRTRENTGMETIPESSLESIEASSTSCNDVQKEAKTKSDTDDCNSNSKIKKTPGLPKDESISKIHERAGTNKPEKNEPLHQKNQPSTSSSWKRQSEHGTRGRSRKNEEEDCCEDHFKRCKHYKHKCHKKKKSKKSTSRRPLEETFARKLISLVKLGDQFEGAAKCRRSKGSKGGGEKCICPSSSSSESSSSESCSSDCECQYESSSDDSTCKCCQCRMPKEPQSSSGYTTSEVSSTDFYNDESSMSSCCDRRHTQSKKAHGSNFDRSRPRCCGNRHCANESTDVSSSDANCKYNLHKKSRQSRRKSTRDSEDEDFCRSKCSCRDCRKSKSKSKSKSKKH